VSDRFAADHDLSPELEARRTAGVEKMTERLIETGALIAMSGGSSRRDRDSMLKPDLAGSWMV
jgi:hypothetical protein